MRRENNPAIVRIAGVVFALVGLVFAGIAVFMYTSDSNTKAKLTEVTGGELSNSGYYIDDDGDAMYKPTYTYTVNGEEYRCGSIASSSTVPEDIVDVYYNPNMVEECRTSRDDADSVLFYAIFGGMGVLFVIIGIICLIKSFVLA